MLGIAGMLSAGVVGFTASSASATADSNPNAEAYWQNLYPGTTCVKHEVPPNDHITNDGNAVTLDSDGSVVLIVKGGSDGGGNAVYEHPKAGTHYFAPLNSAGEQAAVSHWIVCKSTTTPPVTRTISTIAAPRATPPDCRTDGTLVIPATEGITWAGGSDGDGEGDYTLTASAKDGYQIEPGVQTQFQITVLAATGDCPASVTEISLPAQPQVTDPCGPNNATWIVPGNTASVTWSLANGVLTASTTADFTFPNGETSHSFGTAPDSGELCASTTPKDAVATAVANDDATCTRAGTVTFNTTHATWQDGDDTSDGSRIAVAEDGHQFSDGSSQTTVNYTVHRQKSGADCASTTAKDAMATAVANDDATCTRAGTVTFNTTHATWQDGDDTSDGSRIAVAEDGHQFSDGSSQTTVNYTVHRQKSGADCVVPPVTSIPPQVGGVKVTAPPTKVEGVKHTAPPVVTPTVKGVKHEAAAALPRTGTEAGAYGLAGVLLLLMGSGLVIVTRRSTARH